METLATIVGFASGFALWGYGARPINLLATSLFVDASLAPLTAVIARRRGRHPALWAALGFAFGMWALAIILLLHLSHPNRNQSNRRGGPQPSPRPDAA